MRVLIGVIGTCEGKGCNGNDDVVSLSPTEFRLGFFAFTNTFRLRIFQKKKKKVVREPNYSVFCVCQEKAFSGELLMQKDITYQHHVLK